MRIVFLDFDGVLNSLNWEKEIGHLNKNNMTVEEIEQACFSPKLVENLNKLTTKFDAKIVVSSSWKDGRSLDELQIMLKKAGVTGDVIDKTPTLDGACRGDEIADWLRQRFFYRTYRSEAAQEAIIVKSKIENYVILDDTSSFLYDQREHVVKTSPMDGFVNWYLDEAIRILDKTIPRLYFDVDVYCAECGACGEEGCCSGAHCRKLQCDYGKTYKRDYLFNSDLSNKLFQLIEKSEHSTPLLKETAKQIWDEVWDEFYSNKNIKDDDESITES